MYVAENVEAACLINHQVKQNKNMFNTFFFSFLRIVCRATWMYTFFFASLELCAMPHGSIKNVLASFGLCAVPHGSQ